MITLYVKTGCPFCAKVIAVVDELNLDVEYKNKDDEGVIDELMMRGGKSQYPYLVDTEREVEIYESDDIVAHLRQHYGAE